MAIKAQKQRIQLVDKSADKKTPSHRIDRTAQHQTDLQSNTHNLNPGELSPQDVMRLQATRGNQSVMRMLAQRDTKRSTGNVQRLPDPLQGEMGKIFDANLSDVHVHTDSQADAVARRANSDATTIGQDIYFQQGAYRPGTSTGNALIAREVSHIQRAKMTGTPLLSSAALSTADKQDAQEVGGIVQSLGKNPSNVLKPANGPDGKPSKTQRSVLQRDEFSGGRTAGIITSKVVQGIFTTVLGPIGLVWRYPIIQKNLGEITGWDQFGSRKGKTDDRMRYGESKLGTAMRWMAGISELLKEFTIWLGFATFIAAIVAAATHGALAPVFLGLGIATSVVAGVHAVLRGLLVAMNRYRLWAAMKSGTDKDKAKIPFIKAQMVSDGMEGIGAALSSIFSGMSAGGLGSLGGDLSKMVGVDKTMEKLVGVGMSTATSLPQNIGLTTLKEGGKESVKPSGKESGWKGFKEGFFKDKTEIDNAYKNTKSFGFRSKPKPQPQVNQVQQTPPVDPNIVNVLDMTSSISSKSEANTQQQQIESNASQENSQLMDSMAPQVIKATASVGGANKELKETEKKVEDSDKDIPKLVEQSVGGSKEEAKRLSSSVKEGLNLEAPKTPNDEDKDSTSVNATAIAQIDNDNKNLDQDPSLVSKKSLQRKPGLRSRIANWFASKIGGLKAGVRRLNGRILAGVLKYAGKFDKSEGDRKIAIQAMAEEKDFASKDAKDESENDLLFLDFQDKAGQLNSTAQMLAEMDRG